MVQDANPSVRVHKQDQPFTDKPLTFQVFDRKSVAEREREKMCLLAIDASTTRKAVATKENCAFSIQKGQSRPRQKEDKETFHFCRQYPS